MTTQATPGALGSNDQLGPLPEPHLHTTALAVMNAGWERGGHVYSAAQMHAYASQEVAAALARASYRNADLLTQCRDHDTRRAAAVAQAASLAAEVERLNVIISRLYAEGQDAVEM